MWRAWKKRRGKLKDGLERAKGARDVANKASENFVKVREPCRRYKMKITKMSLITCKNKNFYSTESKLLL